MREIIGRVDGDFWASVFSGLWRGPAGKRIDEHYASLFQTQRARLGDFRRLADLRGLTGSIANGFRVEVCGIPGSRMRGTGAPSFVFWKYPGLGATRLL